MKDPAAEIENFMRSLDIMGIKAAEVAVLKHPLPWDPQLSERMMRDLSDQVDQILERDHGSDPIPTYRDMAVAAFQQRYNDLYDAWLARGPHTRQ